MSQNQKRKSGVIAIVNNDEADCRVLHQKIDSSWGYPVTIFPDGEAALQQIHPGVDVVLLAITLPGISGLETLRRLRSADEELPVIMVSGEGSVETAVEALHIGAADYFTRPIDFPRLEVALRNAVQMRTLEREVRQLRESAARTPQYPDIIAGSGPMNDLLRLVEKVKDTDITVLVQGESGTGKELIARAIHFNGRRREGPFVVVNCASIPGSLLESELFGHERGAFTGAVQRKPGKFEQADGGSVFLDEIAELDMNLQAKLLRVLQTKQFERVGGHELLTADVRVISASNKDLHKEVAAGQFREDLYYRLASFPILIPPLRERKEDILLLTEHFLRRAADRNSKSVAAFSRSALTLIYQYSWPGNIRELEHAVERAVILAEGNVVEERELPMAVRAYGTGDERAAVAPAFGEAETTIQSFETIKEEAIRNALRITGGNAVEASRRLKIGRATLYRLAKKFHISI